MNNTQEKKLKDIAAELAKDIKTGEDLSALSSQLVKLTVEAALGAEMERHLGHPSILPKDIIPATAATGQLRKL